MSLIKFRGTSPVADPFGTLFDDFLGSDFFDRQRKSMRMFSNPAANIRETEKAYFIELAAPGLDKGDFKVEVNEDLLTINAEREQKREENTENFSMREFNYERFSRSFRLPQLANGEAVSATYRDGVLHIEIPKKAEQEHKKTIAVK